MQIPLLKDIVIIIGLAIAVLFICHRFRVPSMVGLLLTGLFVGPYGLGLINEFHEVEIFAEVGVVLLLFTIGIEFSLERLVQIRKSVLIGGPLQVMLTTVIAAVIFLGFDQPLGKAVFIGFLVTLSSTAIVLKLIQERAEVDSPHGRTALGILIFQDMIIVPMILITPLLAGKTGNPGATLLILLGKGIVIIILVMVAAKYVVPQLLYQIAKTRNQELFLLSVVVLCFGVAWLTSKAGLSLALGAFLAGLIVSESEYSHHALGNILPFRDVFTTFFFVSIGMLLDLNFLFQQFGPILALFLGVVVLKTMITGSVTVILGFPLRTGLLVGISLGQIGEFSFILSKSGVTHGLLAGDYYQKFLAVTILSMLATPFMITFSHWLAGLVPRLPLPKRLAAGINPVKQAVDENKQDHLIIIGFGVNGKNVAHAAKVAGIPYGIVEMNPDTVRSQQARGEPIWYGDATHEAVLERARIKTARMVVVAINDPTATRRITEQVRSMNQNVHLLVRSRYIQEMKPLYDLGADEVIPEEYETSIEIFARVLARYMIPRHEIKRMVAEIRADGYEMLRGLSNASASFYGLNLQLHDVDVSTIRIPPDSAIIGQSFEQVELRKLYEISVVAVSRDSEILANPGGDTRIQPNDVLFVLGKAEKISEAVRSLSPAPAKDERRDV